MRGPMKTELAAVQRSPSSPVASPSWPAPRPGAPWLVYLPTLLALAMYSLLLSARVRDNQHLLLVFLIVPTALLVWQTALLLFARTRGRSLAVETMPPVKQHWIQACVQCSLYAYWGFWWQLPDGTRPIYAQLPLILAQFAFLYAFDALFAWTRGRPWRLGSGPTPIVLSTNLFIWFRDDVFAWQFAMVAAGLLGKEFVRWTKDGRRTHVFNPSGFGLACAATALIATGSTDLTWAKSLATTIEVPFAFVFLFGLGMVVQHFFRVTLMTFAAALAMVAINLAYTGATGSYLFASTNLPAAAFLGLHLLMTDPSTSPRSNVGRTLFGLGYGCGYVVAFEVLGALGAPELFAKLYPVPILNCCVQWFDRLAQRGALGELEQRWQALAAPRTLNALHMAAWAAVFALLVGTGYVQGKHPGDSIAFWKRAVADGKPDAARKVAIVAGSQAELQRTPAEAQRSAAALNELGILALRGDIDPAAMVTRHKSAAAWWGKAMQRGSTEAAENIVMHFLFAGLRRSDAEVVEALARLDQLAGKPGHARAAQLLGLVLETGAGRPQEPGKALLLYGRCGDDVFARKGLVRLALGGFDAIDLARIAPTIVAAVAQQDAEACYYLACMQLAGRGAERDVARARALLEQASARGFAPAKQLLARDLGGAVPAFVPPRLKQLAPAPWSTAFPLP